MRKRLFRSLRRVGRRWMGLLLARALGRGKAAPKLPTRSIRRVLICRVNRRLGNLVLLTPLIRSLHRILPGARIDVLVGAGAPSEVLLGLEGLGSVHQLPRKPVLTPLALLGLCRRLRAQDYDLAIDPCLSSVTNRLGLTLCRARFRLGFQVADGWAPLTHRVLPDKALAHEALRPLELLKFAFGKESSRLDPALGLDLTRAELTQGLETLYSLLGTNQPARKLVFFCEAAAGKRLPFSWWSQWTDSMRQLAPGLQLIQLLSPAPQASYLEVVRLQCQDSRKLAAILAGCDAFVSGDTGPMHLASAAKVQTIGLFLGTDPIQYRPYGPRDGVICVDGQSPEAVAQQVIAQLDSASVSPLS